MSLTFCCDEKRRALVRDHPTLNGIDFIEVRDDPSQPLADRQRVLLLALLKPPAAPLTADNVRIEGGEAIRDIRVLDVVAVGPLLTIQVDQPGDFSPYTLRLVATASGDDPPSGFDRLLAAVDFGFKVNCATDFDCATEDSCAAPPADEPMLDYLARDFNSVRQVMVDRIRQLNPDWREDHLADLLQVLVDLKAYVADYQHYQLDAINSEAYLFTARSRVSVRRHARLVGYPMHDGCTARVWAQVLVDPLAVGAVALPAGRPLLTRVPGAPEVIVPDSTTHREALAHRPEPFETLHDITLRSDHNHFCFYTWGDDRCILPRGATRATLVGHWPHLAVGDVLILEEVRGALTGDPADADPTRRFAVRLTGLSLGRDELTGTDVTDIRWHPDDALAAPLCLSARVPDSGDPLLCDGAISVARGNIVLAAHGQQLPDEDLGTVPASSLVYAAVGSGPCAAEEPQSVPPRFRPRLGQRPVAQRVPYDHAAALGGSARAALATDPARALPAIELATDAAFAGERWFPQRDLLNSEPNEPAFVLEMESDGSARLRFGDDQTGRRPNAGDRFYARYRIGEPLAGNIGAGALAHIVTSDSAISGVRNPLPAQGGVAPESIEAVRQRAPQAFRIQQRAVTLADYEQVALLFPGVQRAAASFRWTGSWYTLFLTVDRVGGGEIDPDFERALRDHLDIYRMMGYDVEINAPRYVPLELGMRLCVEPDTFRADVRQQVEARFSARRLPDGRTGLFHPDRLTFGQPIYLSHLYAAAEGIPGVQSATITRFRVQDQPATEALDSGELVMGRFEIAQLENNPNFPKRGIFRLEVAGGK